MTVKLELEPEPEAEEVEDNKESIDIMIVMAEDMMAFADNAAVLEVEDKEMAVAEVVLRS